MTVCLVYSPVCPDRRRSPDSEGRQSRDLLSQSCHTHRRGGGRRLAAVKETEASIVSASQERWGECE